VILYYIAQRRHTTAYVAKLIKYEVYIGKKEGMAGMMPANSGGTFAASAIGIQPDTISGYTYIGTSLEASKPGCLAHYCSDNTVTWQNVTPTNQNEVRIRALHLYQKNV